jgi:hypothetical protein
MFASPVRVLVVGLISANTRAMLERWGRSGWASHTVDSVQEAEAVLKTIRFKVILAAENVSDGSGYEVASLVARQSGNLFISVSLSETCLWLPVIEQGARSLGKRAINPWILETEVESILRAFEADPTTGVRGSIARGIASGPVLQTNGAPMNSDVRRDDANLLNPPTFLSSKSLGENGGTKHETPPRRRATIIHGGTHGIEPLAPRESERPSGTNGKRRAE